MYRIELGWSIGRQKSGNIESWRLEQKSHEIPSNPPCRSNERGFELAERVPLPQAYVFRMKSVETCLGGCARHSTQVLALEEQLSKVLISGLGSLDLLNDLGVDAQLLVSP